MMKSASDLLFGILALQLNFIDRSQLLSAFDRWTSNKTRSLAEHLVDLGCLSTGRRELLESLLQEHLQLHAGDAERSLASAGASIDSSLHAALSQQLGAEVTASLRPTSDSIQTSVDSTATYGAKSEGGRFQILRPHAEGGLGRVSVAMDGELHREVAFKEIKPERAHDAFSRARFVLEAEITGGLEHPGIVPVYGLGTHEDGRPFYAMRFVKGDDLRQAIQRLHADKATPSMLETRKLLARFLDVCRAIHYAHSRGVLHRDLKPANVMLGKFGETLVVDWGLAKVIGRSENMTPGNIDESVLHPASASGSEPTMLGQAIGTPAYMSPEQAEGRLDLLSPASDVFSLGIILYELLAGARPFVGENNAEVLERIRRCEFTPPKSLKSWIPKPLEAICLKALSKQPANRYASTELLAADIESWLADEPVTAWREPATAKVRRWARRNPGMVAAFASLLLLGSITAGLIAWQQNLHAQAMVAVNRDLDDQRIKANEEAEKAKQSEANERMAKQEAQRERDRANEASRSESIAKNDTEKNLAQTNLFLANARWEENRFKEAHQLLDQVPEQYRNIEWQLTKEIFRGSDITCYGHTGAVKCVRTNPDGNSFASASADGTIRIWKMDTGEDIRQWNAHAGGVNCIGYSADGEQLVSGGADGWIRVWNATDGSSILAWQASEKAITEIDFLSQLSLLASSGEDGVVRVWNSSDGKAQKTLAQQGQHIALNPNGTQLLTVSANSREIRVWSVPQFKLQNRRGFASWEYTSVRFSPDGSWVSATDWDRQLEIRTPSLTEGNLFQLPSDRPIVHEFSPSGDLVAVATTDIRLYKRANGSQSLKLKGHIDLVNSIAFSLDGMRLVSGSKDKTIRIWDLRSSVPARMPGGHSKFVTSLDSTRRGDRLVSGSADGSVILWDTERMIDNRTFQHGAWVHGVAFNHLEEQLVSCGSDSRVVVWDVNSGAFIRELKGHSASVNSVATHGNIVATGSSDKSILIWDLNSGALLQKLLANAPVYAVAISPDGNKLAAGGSSSSDTNVFCVNVWDLGEPSRPTEQLLGHSDEVRSLAFSADGKLLASGSQDKTVRVWKTSDGSCIRVLRDLQVAMGVAFSPTADRVIIGCRDHHVQVFETSTGKELISRKYHSLGIFALKVSHAGDEIISGGIPNELFVLRMKNDNQVRVLRGHIESIISTRFGSDSSQLFTYSDTESLRWDLNSGKKLEEPAPVSSQSSDHFSSDGRWMVVPLGNEVMLVDRHYNSQPVRVIANKNKAKNDSVWHRERIKSIGDADPYAQLFHLAWILIASPNSAAAYSDLHDAYDSLQKQSNHSNTTVFSPAIVQSLQLPPGTEGTEADLWRVGDRLERTGSGEQADRFFGLALEKNDASDEISKNIRKARILNLLHRKRSSENDALGERLKSFQDSFDLTAPMIQTDWMVEQLAENLLHRISPLGFTVARFQGRVVDSQLQFKVDYEPNWHSHVSTQFPWNRDPNSIDANSRLQFKKRGWNLKQSLEYELQGMPRTAALWIRADEVSARLELASNANAKIWDMVKSKSSPQVTDDKLSEFAKYCEEFPQGVFNRTLGAARYRRGEFKEALEDLRTSLGETPKEQNLSGPHPYDLAFLAMSHFQLGNIKEANDYRSQFLDAMKQSNWKDEKECISFGIELNELFEQPKE